VTVCQEIWAPESERQGPKKWGRQRYACVLSGMKTVCRHDRPEGGAWNSAREPHD
jgi:hypothetical protein